MNRRHLTPHNHPKLTLLREYDRERLWQNLDDQRVCLLCGTEFDGHSIRVQIQAGRPRFLCPNINCRGELPLFASGGNPLLNETLWSDWMRQPAPEGPLGKNDAHFLKETEPAPWDEADFSQYPPPPKPVANL